MDSMDLSRIQRKQVITRATGFGISGEEESYSDLEEDLAYDNIEADYIEKLKIQRQRMEKLEKCYYEKEQQLGRQVDRTNQLLSEVEKMASYIPYKQKYQDLRQDYNELLTKFNIQQGDLQTTKEELNQVIHENSNTISHLKGQLKVWKETSNLNVTQLQQALSDKEQQIRKMKKDWREKQDEMYDEIKALKNYIGKLKQDLENQSISFDKQKERLCSDLKNKDMTISQLEKSLENSKKINMDLKSDVLRYSQEVNSRQRQYASSNSKLKHQISLLKKTISQKDSKIENLESSLKKNQAYSSDLKEDLQNLKIDYKKTCQMYESSHKKIRYESQSEISRLQAFIQELKDSVEELMEVKNHLLGQNRRFVAILKKKEQSDRQRKQLLMTQFKEIDRIEKVIDRLQ